METLARTSSSRFRIIILPKLVIDSCTVQEWRQWKHGVANRVPLCGTDGGCRHSCCLHSCVLSILSTLSMARFPVLIPLLTALGVFPLAATEKSVMDRLLHVAKTQP